MPGEWSKVLLGLGEASSFLLRDFSKLCLRDESSGRPREPKAGAGGIAELGAGSWACAGLSGRAKTTWLMNLTKSDNPELQVTLREWGGGSG